MRVAFIISYIGTNFSGSQQQPGLRTVEGEFIDSCIELGLFSDWKVARFQSSGRTDRGVHARSQICTFDTKYPGRAVSKINKKLPGDIWCQGWAEVSKDFNPRFEASSRTYRYFFPDSNLDIGSMASAAESLIGTHDFTRFARIKGRNPEREIISARIVPDHDGLILEICARSFLWNMVRCIAHVLWRIGEGSAPTEIIKDAVLNTDGPRFPVAPAEGLVLWDIETNIDFSPMINHQKSDKFLESFRCRHHQLVKIQELLKP